MKRQGKMWLYSLFVVFAFLLSGCTTNTADPGLHTEAPADTAPVVADLDVVADGQSE